MHLILILMAFLLIYLVMAVKGPSVWDRLLGLNLVSTKIIVIILLFASIQGRAYLLDYAFVFALIGFIGTIFIILFWSTKRRGKK